MKTEMAESKDQSMPDASQQDGFPCITPSPTPTTNEKGGTQRF
jgi:hypothetical protein